jgi:hypothetical protein
MKSIYITFLKRILIFTAIIGTIAGIIHFVIPGVNITPALPFLILFFLSVTLISYYLQLKSASERFIRFVNAYMLLMAAKLFLFITVIVAYVFTHRSDVVPFMGSFFILYLCYTIFEAASLLQNQGKPKE